MMTDTRDEQSSEISTATADNDNDHPYTSDDYAALTAELLDSDTADAPGDDAPGDDANADGDGNSDSDSDGGSEPASGREARYRQRARAAEAEVSRLATLLESLQRTEIERLVRGVLTDAEDLWRDGAQLADVVDHEGRVDPDKLNAVVSDVLAAHPHWRAPLPRYNGPFYSGAVNTRLIDTPSRGFAHAFKAQEDRQPWA